MAKANKKTVTGKKARIDSIAPRAVDPNQVEVRVGGRTVATLLRHRADELGLAEGAPWTPALAARVDAAAAEARFYRVVGTPIVGERGRLISTTLVTNLSQFQIQLIFGFGGIPITPQSGVKVYKVLYETVDAQGLRTQASGSLCLPDNRHIPESLVQPGLAICCLLRGPTHRDLLENSRLSANLQAQSEAERRRRSG